MRPDDNGSALSGNDYSLRWALLSQRPVRDITQEAVPRQLLEECIEVAVRALSPVSATPAWAFVLVEAEDKRRSIGQMSRAWGEAHAAGRGAPPALQARVGEGTGRIGQAPWIVVPCYRIGGGHLEHDEAVARYGLIFRAVQNLLLAFHAAGLGARLTTMALHDPAALCRLLALPDGMLPCSVIPVGWPAAPPDEPTRGPTDSVTYLNDFSHPLPVTCDGLSAASP